MGDVTVIQLLDKARRQRDGDAARQWTTSDGLTLPVVVVFGLVIVSWVLVVGVVHGIRRLFGQLLEADSVRTYTPQPQHDCGLRGDRLTAGDQEELPRNGQRQ